VSITAVDNQTPGATTTVQHQVIVTTPSTVDVDRYDGASRYGTGAAVSQAAFPKNGSAGAVILARGDVFADALAGIPLAKAKNAPLLLTPGGAAATTLDSDVQTELLRVLPSDGTHTVYILGGEGAISKAIEDHISGLGYTVVRLKGDTRFQTALAIAQDPRGLNNPTDVVVARGDDFADALAAGPFAANYAKDSNGVPAAIVLSSGPASAASVDPATAAFVTARMKPLTGGAITPVWAIGGGAQAAVQSLAANGRVFGQLVGKDRYATAAAVASEGWFATDTAAIDGTASGMSFADALTGGAYMALKNGPLLLTDPAQLSADTAHTIHGGQKYLWNVAVFGGTSVLNPSVIGGIGLATNPIPTKYTEHHMPF
jgi:hypothetical protein